MLIVSSSTVTNLFIIRVCCGDLEAMISTNWTSIYLLKTLQYSKLCHKDVLFFTTLTEGQKSLLSEFIDYCHLVEISRNSSSESPNLKNTGLKIHSGVLKIYITQVYSKQKRTKSGWKCEKYLISSLQLILNRIRSAVLWLFLLHLIVLLFWSYERHLFVQGSTFFVIIQDRNAQ